MIIDVRENSLICRIEISGTPPPVINLQDVKFVQGERVFYIRRFRYCPLYFSNGNRDAYVPEKSP